MRLAAVPFKILGILRNRVDPSWWHVLEKEMLFVSSKHA